MSIEKGTGFSSPNTSLVLLQLMDEESSLGGVPVFKRDNLKPLFTIDSVKSIEGFSPKRPAEYFLSPIWINPLKKVPEHTINAEVLISLPLRSRTDFNVQLLTVKSTTSSGKGDRCNGRINGSRRG